MLVKSPGIGTCVTNRIELVGPACAAKAAASDIQSVILVISTGRLTAVCIPNNSVGYPLVPPRYSATLLALCGSHRRNSEAAHVRHHLASGRGQDHVDGKAAPLRRRGAGRRLG